jgi:hypothetical protein
MQITLPRSAPSAGREQQDHGSSFARVAPVLIESECDCLELQPITVGLPFPRGTLHDSDRLGLFDDENQPAPLQKETLARWSDGSVRWLLLDFLLPAARKGTIEWALGDQGPTASHARPEPISIRDEPGALVVNTGVATFQVDCNQLSPLKKVSLGGREIMRSSRVALLDPKNRLGTPRVDQVAVETHGPVRATVRLEGSFKGRVPCRFVARLCFFAGTGLVRFRLTLHNPRRARHPGGIWDLGDPGSMLFRDLSLELDMEGTESPRASWAAEPGQPLQSTDGSLEIYQDSSGGENWKGRNHVNRNRSVPNSFRGYRARSAAGERTGLRANPVVSLTCGEGRMTAALPEFWQQFPKSIEADNRCLRVRLFPGQYGDSFELQGGEQKTHTVWLCFGEDGPSALRWVHQPAYARSEPAWYESSRALSHLTAVPLDSSGERLKSLLTEVVDGSNSFFARREIIDEYGWRHYGEVYADHEATYYEGPRPVISHYNNQYDVVYGTLFHYLRTGDARWLRLADPLARHVIDIDIYHTRRDKAAYNGGLFWFTDHYKDAVTSTHRTYSRHNCRPGDRSYGGGPASDHNFTTGLLHYYYLTGDPQASAAVLSLADWVVNLDDGRKNVLGLVDDGPTGKASGTGADSFQGPGRGAGNSVNALLDAWLLSGQRNYLQKAEELLQRTSHPATDIAALDLLNVEKRWSYTVYLTTLARYLDLKAEAAELDFGYAYGRATLLAYARWMADHEVPYFDHAEQLEFPTEVWAAQELRKANVLRLAAAHADEPLRSRFLARGQELAERGWNDLLRFESRTVARTLAVVMVEGARDAYFRFHPVAAVPRPATEPDFGKFTTFVPQRSRVSAQLKTLRGLASAVYRLAAPWLLVPAVRRLWRR